MLRDYADEGYYNINLYLRHHGNVASMKKATSSYLSPWIKSGAKTTAHLDTMVRTTAVLDHIFTKFALPTALTVYRGTESELGLFANPKTLVGKTLTLAGYSSCTTDEEVARDWEFQRGVLLVLTVPRGAHAIPMVKAVAGESHEEAEVLLPHNTRITITKATLEKGDIHEDIWVLHATVV